jgi:hypothetical protein
MASLQNLRTYLAETWTDEDGELETEDAAYLVLLDAAIGNEGLIERAHKANIARLQLLADDAEKMRRHTNTTESEEYYTGLRDGLRRAIQVLNGEG